MALRFSAALSIGDRESAAGAREAAAAGAGVLVRSRTTGRFDPFRGAYAAINVIGG
jgi:hypothetical protein